MEARSLTLLAVVVALALGFGGGFVVGSGGRPIDGPSPTRSMDPDRGFGESAPSPIASTPERDGRRRSAAPPGQAAPLPVSDAEVARAVQDAGHGIEGEPATGDLTISGVVIDRDGAAVEGAVVQIVSRAAIDDTWSGLPRLDPELGSAAPMSSSAQAARAARLALERRRGAREATADAAGAFEIDGVRPGRYRARAYAAGFDCDPVEVTAGQRVEIVLDPVRVLRIEPRLPDGSTPESAVVVQHLQFNRTLLRDWTPDAPTIEVSEPVVELAVLAGEVMRTTQGNRVHATLQSGVKSVDVESDAAEPAVFDLAPRSIIRATLVDRSPRMAGVNDWLFVNPVGSDDRENLHLLEDGRWSIAVSGPGDREVSASRSTGSMVTVVTTPEPASVTDVVLELPENDPSKIVEIICVGPSDEPVRDVDLKMRFKGTDYDYAAGVPIPRPGGRYWILRSLLHPEGTPLPDDGAVVVGISERFGRAEVWVPRGAPAATLRFSAPSEVIVRIAGDPADRLAFVMIPADTKNVERAVGDATRNWMFWEGERIGVPIDAGRVTPGDYDFHLYSIASRNRGHLVATRKVVLEPGRTLVELESPPLDSFEVLVPGSKNWTQVRIERLDATPSEADIQAPTAFSREAGRARFTGVPPGRYRLETKVNGDDLAAEITVPCGTVQLQPVGEEDG